MSIPYPFTAIVGQESMKQALLCNVVNPRLGGVLIRGEKGTAKSTAVRSLASLLPEIRAVRCACGCDPAWRTGLCPECRELLAQGQTLPVEKRRVRVVDLPVGATEDRLVGSLDIEQALRHGEKRFEPGILAQANRGLLYVDEVNLLDDHLVDVLLDAAAMGVNTVEREGVSITHPAAFVLVGTMNPEEGELRPQLLDRFALCVRVEGIADAGARVEIVKRRAAFEANPGAFARSWQAAEKALAADVRAARKRLSQVRLDDAMLLKIAGISLAMGVDGHRADIVMMKTAMTLAALAGRIEVLPEDLRAAAFLALPHRMRRKPFQEVALDRERLEELLAA